MPYTYWVTEPSDRRSALPLPHGCAIQNESSLKPFSFSPTLPCCSRFRGFDSACAFSEPGTGPAWAVVFEVLEWAAHGLAHLFSAGHHELHPRAPVEFGAHSPRVRGRRYIPGIGRGQSGCRLIHHPKNYGCSGGFCSSFSSLWPTPPPGCP